MTMQNLRLAFRQLRNTPLFTAIALTTFALGIGVNTSIFTALEALLNRQLPYSKPDELVQVFNSSPGSPRQPHHSTPDFLDYQASGLFQHMAALNDKPFNLAEAGEPAESVRGLQVSADLFPLLGIPAELGRVFTPDEDRPGRNQVALLAHAFWQRRFASDPQIVGRTLRLDGEPVTVVGVMPARFQDPLLMGGVDLWRPIAFTATQREERGHHFLKAIARVRPGMSLAQAQAALDVLAEHQKAEHPEDSPEALRLEPLSQSSLPPVARTIVWSIMGLAGFVLLIACANLANLQLARTTQRSRDFAIRTALGAPRGHLMRQVFSESLALALSGGLLGLLVAHWSNQLLRQQFTNDGESLLQLSLNARVLIFALLVATASGLASGLPPAWWSVATDFHAEMQRGGRGNTADRSQHRLQHALIILQMALALVLLAGAGLLVTGLRSFGSLQPGWQPTGMSLGYLTLPPSKYGNDDALCRFVEHLEQQLYALPGTESATICWNLPLRQFNVSSSFTLDGHPLAPAETERECYVNGVTPAYFQTLKTPLLAGRAFDDTDAQGRPPVVIINETMARTFWPDRSPLGDRLNGAEIVGVVGNVRFPGNPSQPRTAYQTYRPYAQEPRPFLNIAVRGPASADSLRDAITQLDPDLPLVKAGSATAEIGGTLGRWAIGGKLLTALAVLGLGLAGIGLYGVVSGFVSRRTSEIGVRMALGAQIHSVVWYVMRNAFSLSATGSVLGVLGAIGLARLLKHILPELPGHSPIVLLACVFFLAGVTLAASWLPARRAARLDPMAALRAD